MNSLDHLHRSNLSQFADHSAVQIAKVSKKGRFKTDAAGRPTIDLKVLDLNNISRKKLDKYFDEGTLVYVLDGHEAQFSSDFALKHLGPFQQCNLTLLPLQAKKDYTQLRLSNVRISFLESKDYKAIKEVCKELLRVQKKGKEPVLKERTFTTPDDDLQAKEKIKSLIAKTWFQREEETARFLPSIEDAESYVIAGIDLQDLLALRATSQSGREKANARLVTLINEGAITPTSLGIYSLPDLLTYFGKHVRDIKCLNTGPICPPGSSVPERIGFNPDMSDKEVKLLVESCPRLTELVLYQFSLTNKSGAELSKLTRLTHLSFNSGEDFTDFSFIGNLKELRLLSLGGSEVSDLSFLKELTRLETLNLEQCNSIQDVNQIASAPQLKHLNLSQCWDIKDFTFLKHLTRLERLDLMECNIKQLSILEDCKELRTLTLWGCNRVVDWDFLGRHPEIDAIGARTSN
ncbi:leucine-rich repeat domain-containing protein [Estrella lausannensis]|uniref:Leucine Rich repeats (2 copies) n=1 Tax=Estrella lausannensis TaxID=483423 RepID=A0A0H5E3J9_9BACT|nr:leucine-rich repeat domain-containing protein [Estrella lausannensis]CRX37790.1 hypothetical protein ELAC_0434 [Estrella lausannensis]